jgi:hypothetical protein
MKNATTRFPHAAAAQIAATFRAASPVLACYYATTLGIPLARGAEVGAGPLLEHAAFVLAVPAFLLSVVGLARAVIRR